MNYFSEEDTQISEFFEFDIESDFEYEQDLSMCGEQARKFELLSAYIDGEVTPEQRRQVQAWLDTDAEFKKLYLSLSRLQQDLKQAPVPPNPVSVEDITRGVFKKIDRQRNRRLVLAGSAFLAMVILGATSYLFPERNSSITQMAMNSSPAPETDSLMIGINDPIVEIPDKAK